MYSGQAMDLTEAQLLWTALGVLLVSLLLVCPALSTAITLIREQRLLGKLYWQVRIALDRFLARR